MDHPKSLSLWIFGYGSLCWHPGFKSSSSTIGYVKNYVRRFWQGNTTHRGMPGKGWTWGVAYEITGKSALQYLNEREITLGGYTTELTTFYPRDGTQGAFPVLLYIATPSSKDWAGPAPLHEIATQITQSSGPKGHNVEYVLRLAEFMREHIPEVYDEHLCNLESMVRLRIKEKNLCLKSLMGPGPSPTEGVAGVHAAVEVAGGGGVPDNDPNQNIHHVPVEERRNTFTYSTQLPKKKLRCLNV